MRMSSAVEVDSRGDVVRYKGENSSRENNKSAGDKAVIKL